MHTTLPSQLTRVKQTNQGAFVNHPLSNYANQLVAEPKTYTTLQGIELCRGEYQQLNK